MTDSILPAEEHLSGPPASDAGAALVLKRAREVLAATPMSGDFTANSLWGLEMAQKISGGEELFILDVRERDQYARAHIPGSVNIPFGEWPRAERLAALPVDMKIVVVCDNGVLASQAVAGLRLLGFDAHALKTGIHGWAATDAGAALAQRIRSAAGAVERTPPHRSWPEKESLGPFGEPSKSEYDCIAGRALAQMQVIEGNGGFPPHHLSAAELSGLMESGPEGLFLMDVRREEDYEGVGHIAGAVHIDFDSALSPEALKLLPPGKKIVTICYTGNLAAQLAMMLRLMGRDAAVLEYGMVAWTRTPTAFHYLKDLESARGELAGGP